MAEVKESSQPPNGAGLFATRGFAEGEEILREERPLVRLAPANDEMEEQMILTNLVEFQKKEKDGKKRLSLRDCVSVPPSVAAWGPSWEAKFRAMIQAALCFVGNETNDEAFDEDALLQLYHPNLKSEKHSESEDKVVRTAQLALQRLGTLAKPGSLLERMVQQHKNDDDNNNNNNKLFKIMLIWACNSFEGGRVYNKTSRINHSCRPNANVSVDQQQEEEAMTIRAVAPIENGDEICISYLDSHTFLYADTRTRRQALQRDKFFVCGCARCCAGDDVAASIPCPQCHPRMQPGKRQLEEDVQYDDEQTVKYARPDNNSVGRIWKCAECGWSEAEETEGTEHFKLFQTSQSVVDKVVHFLQDHESRKLQTVKDEDEEDESVHAERLEQHLSLASSVLGAKHWATNVLLWIELDQTLQEFHGRLLDPSGSDDNSDDDTKMETIAECMDQLQRISRFVDGLGLRLHRGHWLSDVVVGCARALVSLGDVKSQKFAADTLDKYLLGSADDKDETINYVRLFESEGMQKVVHTLKNAWKRTAAENGDDCKPSGRPEKRAKRS